MAEVIVNRVAIENEKLSKYAILAWVFATFAFLIDFMDWQMLANVAPMIAKEFSFSKSQMATLLGAPLLGAGLGGIISGWVSDRIGRVKTMAICITWFSVFTVFFPYCNGFESMVTFRILAGLGLGAQWGVGNTLVAEWLPSSKRVLGSAVIQVGSAAGLILAAVLVATIAPKYGWRPVFYVGTVGFLLAVAALLFLKESEAWLRAKAKHTAGEADLGSLKLLLKPPYFKRAILALLLTSCTLMAYWATASWIPTWLATEKHLSVVKSMNYLYLMGGGAGLGMVFFGLNSWRWGRKRPAFAVLVCCVPVTIVFASIGNPNQLLMFTPVYAFVIGQIHALFGGFLSELFPTEIRGTAVTGIYNLARCLTFFAPILLAAIANATSMTFAIGISAALYALALIPLWLLPETKGLKV